MNARVRGTIQYLLALSSVVVSVDVSIRWDETIATSNTTPTCQAFHPDALSEH